VETGLIKGVKHRAEAQQRGMAGIYGIVDHRLYVAVATDGWKARQIATGQEVAVTVPVRRGSILSLLMPIPPATITSRATATVHPAGSLDVTSVSKDLAKLVPDERRESSVLIELVPTHRFVTYGIGVSLMGHARSGACSGLGAYLVGLARLDSR
jgi:hypothetical protein